MAANRKKRRKYRKEPVPQKVVIKLKGSGKSIPIEATQLFKGVKLFRAIYHPVRLRILEFIGQEGPVNVTQIYMNLNMEQSITSQHLTILREAGFVIPERRGKNIFYTVNAERLEQVLGFVSQLGEAAPLKRRRGRLRKS